VSIALTGWVPEIAGGWVTVQVGTSAAPDGPVTAHVSATLPVKPPLGVTVMVDVVAPPAATAAAAVELSANVGDPDEPIT
jgi:hypothetical protein